MAEKININSLGEAMNNAMSLVEAQSEQLTGVLPKTYNVQRRPAVRLTRS